MAFERPSGLCHALLQAFERREAGQLHKPEISGRGGKVGRLWLSAVSARLGEQVAQADLESARLAAQGGL